MDSRIAAGPYCVEHVVGFREVLDPLCNDFFRAGRGASEEFGSRERQEVVDAAASGKRLADFFEQEEVLGACKYVLAEASCFIGDGLDVREQIGGVLCFVNDDLFGPEASEEARGIFEGEVSLVGFFEGEVVCVGKGCFDEGGFARLAWPGDNDDGVPGGCLGDVGL